MARQAQVEIGATLQETPTLLYDQRVRIARERMTDAPAHTTMFELAATLAEYKEVGITMRVKDIEAEIAGLWERMTTAPGAGTAVAAQTPQ